MTTQAIAQRRANDHPVAFAAIVLGMTACLWIAIAAVANTAIANGILSHPALSALVVAGVPGAILPLLGAVWISARRSALRSPEKIRIAALAYVFATVAAMAIAMLATAASANGQDWAMSPTLLGFVGIVACLGVLFAHVAKMRGSLRGPIGREVAWALTTLPIAALILLSL